MSWISDGLLAAGVSVAILGVVPSSADAAAPTEESSEQEVEDVETALEHFNQGIALYEEGDFASALFEFRRAHDKAPDYRLWYNIGVTQLAMRDYASAQVSLQSYVDEGGDEIGADRRADVLAELKTLESRVGSVVVRVDVEGSRVLVDGEDIGTTPLQSPIRLNLGTHEIEISAPDRQTFTQRVVVVGGSEAVVEARLQPKPPPVSAPAPQVEASKPPPRDFDRGLRTPRLKTATWVMMGTTAAVGIGAIVTGAYAVGAKNDLEDELDQFPADPEAIESAEGRRSTLAWTTDGLVAGTATLAAVTLGLGIAVILSQRAENRAAASRARVQLEPLRQRIRF